MHKLVTHAYFMDEMTLIEIPIMTKYIEFADVISWSQVRNIMYSTVSPYLKKKNTKLSEILPLPIDPDYRSKDEITTEVDERALQWFKNFKKQKEGK